MSRASINTICTNAAIKLKRLDKECLSFEDIRDALNMSEESTKRYLYKPGYLTKRKYLTRVMGGWIIPKTHQAVIVIEVMINPGNKYFVEEVETTVNNAINSAILKYGKVVTVETEEQDGTN